MERLNQKLWIIVSAIALFVSLQTSALAFVDPPILVPPNADVGQSIGVQFTSGDCDAFGEDPDGAYPQLTVTGNQIHLVMFSVHYEGQLECIFAPETFIQPLGIFDAGQYVVIVDRVYPDYGGLTTERLAALPLVVGGVGPSPAQLPSNAPLAMLLMLLGVVLIALRKIRSAKSNCSWR